MVTHRALHIVSGNVQGVGFRPFIYTTAQHLGLTGFVQNTHEGVRIEVQGSPDSLDSFCRHLCTSLPPLALIVSHKQKDIEPVDDETGFSILPSAGQTGHTVFIGADVATCEQCLQDIFDSQNRRYLYPFTNCTNCGPRYSIIRGIPYDRASTSMACFPLCPQCGEEYNNPADRRFHAQPNACSRCGAHVWFVTGSAVSAGRTAMPAVPSTSAIKDSAKLLYAEKILALKGLGGFHLACLATSETALTRLREVKNRPHKPFALMTSQLDDAAAIVRLSSEAKHLLQSPAHPIVICPKRVDGMPLPGSIAPDTDFLGVMLAYTPLHHILFFELKKLFEAHHITQPPVLVMTSGNRGGEPICLGNREALSILRELADGFLLHNRDILIRVDDSVIYPVVTTEHPEIIDNESSVSTNVLLPHNDNKSHKDSTTEPTTFAPGQSGILTPAAGPDTIPCAEKNGTSLLPPLPPSIILRRARGYAPLPVPLPESSPVIVLGVGAELKNTICINKGSSAFVSQHLGDMERHEATLFHDEIVDHLQKILMVRPDIVVHDKHPDYYTTSKALSLGIPALPLQHHAAHAFAVLGENDIGGSSLVLALDGTGYGDDKTLWGGEALLANMDTGNCRRLGSFSPIPLPGGEAAIRQPWRTAHALCLINGVDPALFPWLPEEENIARHIPAMLEKQINTPLSTSCGRLFDAIAALLGLGLTISYEGQAAILLESLALRACEPARSLPCPLYTGHDTCTLDTNKLFVAVCEEVEAGISPATIALSFHETLVTGLAIWAKTLCSTHGLNHVGLSGGCFNNRLLLQGLWNELVKLGLTPVAHRQLPCGDGCISYGQVVWGTIAGRK